MDNIVTPINIGVLDKLLKESNFDENERNFIVSGFSKGFPIGLVPKQQATSKKDVKRID